MSLEYTVMQTRFCHSHCISYMCLEAKYAQCPDKVLQNLVAQARQKQRKIAAYVCRSGYELWKSYLSSLLSDSAGFLRFWAAYAWLIYRNQRDCMTAQIHIKLMTYYHGEIASAFLAGSMWLHLGTSYIQSISFLS